MTLRANRLGAHAISYLGGVELCANELIQINGKINGEINGEINGKIECLGMAISFKFVLPKFILPGVVVVLAIASPCCSLTRSSHFLSTV